MSIIGGSHGANPSCLVVQYASQWSRCSNCLGFDAVICPTGSARASSPSCQRPRTPASAEPLRASSVPPLRAAEYSSRWMSRGSAGFRAEACPDAVSSNREQEPGLEPNQRAGILNFHAERSALASNSKSRCEALARPRSLVPRMGCGSGDRTGTTSLVDS